MSGGWDEEFEADQMAELRQEVAEIETEETGQRPVPQAPDYSQAIEQERQHQPQEQHYQHQHEQQQEYQPQQYAGIPHQNDDPVGHFDARAQQLEQHAVQQQFWNHVTASEDRARQEVGEDYDHACEHLEKGRIKELEKMFPSNHQTAVLARQYGYQSPEQFRAALLDRDRISVAQYAMANGMSPAKVYYDLAKQKGYIPKTHVTRSFMRHLGNLKGKAFDDAWELYEKAASR